MKYMAKRRNIAVMNAAIGDFDPHWEFTADLENEPVAGKDPQKDPNILPNPRAINSCRWIISILAPKRFYYCHVFDDSNDCYSNRRR